jgi:hypothetical protein
MQLRRYENIDLKNHDFSFWVKAPIKEIFGPLAGNIKLFEDSFILASF